MLNRQPDYRSCPMLGQNGAIASAHLAVSKHAESRWCLQSASLLGASTGDCSVARRARTSSHGRRPVLREPGAHRFVAPPCHHTPEYARDWHPSDSQNAYRQVCIGLDNRRSKLSFQGFCGSKRCLVRSIPFALNLLSSLATALRANAAADGMIGDPSL